MSLRTGFMFSY